MKRHFIKTKTYSLRQFERLERQGRYKRGSTEQLRRQLLNDARVDVQ